MAQTAEKKQPVGGPGTNQHGVKGVPKQVAKPTHDRYRRPEEFRDGIRFIARDPEEYEQELAERPMLERFLNDEKEREEMIRKTILGIGFFLFAKLILSFFNED